MEINKTKNLQVNLNENYLIGMRAATKVVQLALQIPAVENEKPLGFIFVARPGTGKSFLLTKFVADNLITVNDITGAGLQRVVEKMKSFEMGYVVIPDLLKIMARTKGWEAFLTLSNILLEEGLKSVVKYDTELILDKPLKFGILTAMTQKMFMENLKLFEKTGFLSRFGIFSFDYEKEDLERVERQLSLGLQPEGLKYIIETPAEKKHITIDIEISTWIKWLGKTLANGKHSSFRAINFVRALTKANAVLNKREKVTLDDVREVYALIPFFVPPTPVSTDLEYLLLKKTPMSELTKYYNRETIASAKQRLIQKGILQIKETVKSNGGGQWR